MTIAEYLETMKQKHLPSDTMLALEIWSNNSALGYTIMAAEATGLKKEQINKLVDAMQAAFDNVSVDQANSYYEHGTY